MKKVYSVPFIVAIGLVVLFAHGKGEFFGVQKAFGYGGTVVDFFSLAGDGTVYDASPSYYTWDQTRKDTTNTAVFSPTSNYFYVASSRGTSSAKRIE